MAFYGPILGLDPTQGTSGDVVEVTVPPRHPSVFNLTSGIPMRVGFSPSPAGVPGTVIGGHEFQARWTVTGPNTLSVVVPPVGHAGPAVEMPPRDYVINLAQGFDRAHTARVFRARLPGPPATIAVPASPLAALRYLVRRAVAFAVRIVASTLFFIRTWLRAPIWAAPPPPPPPSTTLKRVSTAVPWPRGIVYDPSVRKLVVLARGRPRPEGPLAGDRAGTLFEVDPAVFEDAATQPPGDAVKRNAQVLREPTSPPFRLWNAAADESNPQARDIDTDRPYAGLALHPEARAFFVACFSGIDKNGNGNFRKNATDAIHRYDRRDSAWHVVEFHSPRNIPEAERRGRNPGHFIPNNYYPNAGPDGTAGLLNGPDGLCAYGSALYAVAKDNHVIARYNLDAIVTNAAAGAPQGTVLFTGDNQGDFDSPSGVAVDPAGEYLYVSFRAQTKNVVWRFKLNADGSLGSGERVARFPDGSNLIDITFDSNGVLYVSAANGQNDRGAIWKIDRPDPANVFDGARTAPHVSLPRSTSANITVDDQDVLYICCNAKDDPASALAGVVYRVE